jgi:hypothetical protein
MKLIFILPYFGKLPNYFNLILKSIESNKDYNWLIVTDDKTYYNYPDNVILIYKSFEEIKNLFQSKFDFEINLNNAHNLCDLKPTFGYVFEEYIREYEYWGHCDSDVIFGNLNNFLNSELLSKYDKLFVLGHLSIYKNNIVNNKRFTNKINNIEIYKKVFSLPIGTLFDEKFGQSINTIFKSNNYSLFTDSYCADIDSYCTNLRLSKFDPIKNSFYLDIIKKHLFVWDNGAVYRYIKTKKNIIREEFMYIHLQKRPMKINFIPEVQMKILISPQKFELITEEIFFENFNRFYKKKWFNTQYLKVKWKSLLYKIKFKEHFF